MNKGHKGLQQLIERNGVEYTGQYHVDMDNAKKIMRGMAGGNSEALPGSPKDIWLKAIGGNYGRKS